jgi:hypothetical protein
MGGIPTAPVAFPHFNDLLRHDHEAIRRRPDSIAYQDTDHRYQHPHLGVGGTP